MIEEIITVAGQAWRVKAKSRGHALTEIAHARVTGSVGSSTMMDHTQCGGSMELIAEVHKVDVEGKDIQPS